MGLARKLIDGLNVRVLGLIDWALVLFGGGPKQEFRALGVQR
jgi:hypothetical protein